MANFSNESDLIVSLPGQIERYNKASLTAVTGTNHSLWAAAGAPTAGTLTIGDTVAGLVPTAATVGAFSFTNPAGGVQSRMGRCSVQMAIIGAVLFYDRLWHAGSFSLATAGNFAGWTGATAQTRPDALGGSTECWIEINVALAATASTITLTYTNQAGTASRTGTCALPASAISGRMFPVVLQSGDSGIRSIQTISIGTAVATGSMNIVVLRALNDIGASIAGGKEIQDYALTGLPRIYDNACIAMSCYTSNTATGYLQGQFNILQN